MSDPTRAALGSLGAQVSWANTTDRAARTAPARAALEQKFLDQAGGDPDRAEQLRTAYYLRLAQRSAQVRRERAAAASEGAS